VVLKSAYSAFVGTSGPEAFTGISMKNNFLFGGAVTTFIERFGATDAEDLGRRKRSMKR